MDCRRDDRLLCAFRVPKCIPEHVKGDNNNNKSNNAINSNNNSKHSGKIVVPGSHGLVEEVQQKDKKHKKKSRRALQEHSEGALYSGLDPDLMPKVYKPQRSDSRTIDGSRSFHERSSSCDAASEQSDVTSQFWKQFRKFSRIKGSSSNEKGISSNNKRSSIQNMNSRHSDNGTERTHTSSAISEQPMVLHEDSDDSDDSTVSSLSMEDTTIIKIFDKHGQLTKTALQLQQAEAAGYNPNKPFKPPRKIKFSTKETIFEALGDFVEL